ncbi:UNVERIFIED_CONTAM: Benzyl alcohol O-benzoyltransferase [Sesamum calycinum]|uniref:Benzyl alcohol O-benzoyltransferase n=1 Tax=Sesamum calycinum TaxID=2727403 RepID=A0AAW2KEZ3_9LAMI
MVLDFFDSHPPWLNLITVLKSVLLIWQRHLLNARDLPHAYMHHEYENRLDTNKTLIPLDNMVQCSFFVGPYKISAFRCCTIVISPNPDEEVRIICFVDGCRLFNPPLPAGYYGNAIATPVAISTARNLCKQPLDFTLELVMKTKSKMTEDYIKSVADLMVIKGRPHFTVV